MSFAVHMVISQTLSDLKWTLYIIWVTWGLFSLFNFSITLLMWKLNDFVEKTGTILFHEDALEIGRTADRFLCTNVRVSHLWMLFDAMMAYNFPIKCRKVSRTQSILAIWFPPHPLLVHLCESVYALVKFKMITDRNCKHSCPILDTWRSKSRTWRPVELQ